MASNQEKLNLLNINDSALNSLQGEDQAWRVYNAALIYIAAGLLVIPLRKDGKLLPSSSTGINYGSASNNRDTIEKWFNPSTGRFAGWNIGLPCGRRGGIFVVDIDRHGEIDGQRVFQEFEVEYGVVSAPKQTTPNDGTHVIFQWEDNAKSSTSKIGPGIDTRGGTESACKGHIVAAPSIVDGKEYKWEIGGVIPLVPDWIMEKMGSDWGPRRGYGRGNEEVGADDIEQTIPEEQLTRMLQHIDPDSLSYEQWLRIGQAINSQYPDDTGLSLWDTWSQRGDRYKDNECRVRWRGFDPAGAVRAGTLFYFARKGDWKADKEDVTQHSGHKAQIVERLNEDYAIVMIGGKLRVLREKRNPPLLTDNRYDLIGVRDFQVYLQNDTVDLGGKKPTPVSDIWLGDPGRREYPNGLILDPEGDKSVGAYNTWAGYNVAPIDGPCNLFLTHIKEIVCGGNVDHYNWLLDWIADLFQDPANPKGCCIVMRGAEGSGKGTLANTVGEMFGPHYRHLIDDAHLLSNFNAHMIDALFVFADEITWGGNKKTAGKLKGMVTEKYLVGERKGVDAVGYRNMIHMMIASNSEWVIPAGSNSRRWFVLDVVDHKTMDPQYFRDIYSELDNGGREAILHFFLNRAIINNLTRAPETEALQEQRVLSIGRDSVINWWINVVETELFPCRDVRAKPDLDDNSWPDQVVKTELHAEYKQWCLDQKITPDHEVVFCNRLKPFGFLLDKKASVGRKRIRVATVPSLDISKEILFKKHNIRID